MHDLNNLVDKVQLYKSIPALCRGRVPGDAVAQHLLTFERAKSHVTVCTDAYDVEEMNPDCMQGKIMSALLSKRASSHLVLCVRACVAR